ncbi:pyridoxal phosphate-dependent aminotransferase [Paraburkholderia tropica]|uniref:pyridoxal phosphate-dependent aminotransferase n=1 Tax=Paraburkholderia tropica TaxID=92647 RepID=UPI002AB74E18|nr:pyridoxal phosphate-dependent aminotransferase [Paraburkholderia tropica]
MAGQRARELRAQGRDIVDLTAGEPDFPTADNILEAANRAMRDGKTKYTDVGGTRDLKHAIQAKFMRENELDYDLTEIIAGSGAKQVIFNALMTTVQSGVEVIIPAPYWVSYPDMVMLAGGTPVCLPTTQQQDFKIDAQALERAITPRTKWLILNSPCNPSGAVYSRAELRAISDVLLRHPHVWVLTDDIYEHILYDGASFVTIAQVEPQLKSRTLTVNGVSKAYAMTGWRLGYAAGPKELIAQMTKLQSHSSSHPCSISQAAACEALNGPQVAVREMAKRFEVRRNTVCERLKDVSGIACMPPAGAFYLYITCDGVIGARTPDGATLRSDGEFALYLLERENLAVLHGEAYGVSPFIRMSFAASSEALAEGCDRLQRACEALF